MHARAISTRPTLERSGPAIAVIGIHVAMIYVLAASMGIVRIPSISPPAKAVFVPEQVTETPPPPMEFEPRIEHAFPDIKPLQELVFDQPVSDTAPQVPSRPVTEDPPVQPQLPVEPVVEQPPQPVTLRITHRVEPEYPPASRRAGEEGTVHLTVLVDGAGRPREVSVSRSSGSTRLDRAAQDAVRKWRFTRHQQPDAIRTSINITFRLTD